MSSFACFPAPTDYNTSPTLRQAVRDPPVLVPGLFTARLDSTTSQDDTIRNDIATCLDGSTVRELLEKLPVSRKKSNAEGWGIYRCLVDTVITDPISPVWKSNEEGNNWLSLWLERYMFLVPGTIIAKCNFAERISSSVEQSRCPNYSLIVYVIQVSRYVRWDSDFCMWEDPSVPERFLLYFN